MPEGLGLIENGNLVGCNLAELRGFDGLDELVFVGELGWLDVHGVDEQRRLMTCKICAFVQRSRRIRRGWGFE